MNQTPNIQNILNDWGRASRELPVSHEVLKNNLLSKLRPIETPSAKSITRISWLPLALAACAVFAFIITFAGQNQLRLPQSAPSTLQENLTSSGSALRYDAAPAEQSAADQGTAKSINNFIAPWPTPPPISGEIPSTDNREFLKTTYSAEIRTRHAPDLTQHLQTIIRGFDGRIDSTSASTEQGYINFVLPASHLDGFREEVKNIAGARFYTESLNSQNLLPEKRSIEQQRTDAQTALAKLNSDRDQLTANHNQAIASLQSQLDTVANELASLKKEDANTADPGRKAIIASRRQDLQRQQAGLTSRLNDENNSYTNQLNSLNAQVQNTETSLKYIDKQDSNLIDNVATVQGTITLSTISLWEILNLYLPPYWIAYILVLAAIVVYLLQRRGYGNIAI